MQQNLSMAKALLAEVKAEGTAEEIKHIQRIENLEVDKLAQAASDPCGENSVSTIILNFATPSMGRDEVMKLYVDDMIVKSRSASIHKKVLNRYQLKLNPENCTFGISQESFWNFGFS